MLTFEFSNGLVATLRTSGTEPKIKYYAELRAPPEEKWVDNDECIDFSFSLPFLKPFHYLFRDRQKVRETLDEMVKAIIDEFIQPVRFGLIPKAD